jgi:hypothetical protein
MGLEENRHGKFRTLASLEQGKEIKCKSGTNFQKILSTQPYDIPKKRPVAVA